MRFDPSWFDCTPKSGPEPGRPMTASAAEIEAEPMSYNVTDWSVFGETPCPLSRRFMRFAALSGEFDPISQWSLDTRSTMLMPGWYPAIPGWHHDDVDRDATGQPIYHDPSWHQPARRMLTMIIEADARPTGSRTEFVSEILDVTYPVPEGKTVYAQWDYELTHVGRGHGPLQTKLIESGRLYSFGQQDFHRATPATNFGWRWFARLTINPGPRPSGPKIRRQVQIYTPTTEQGW